MSYRMTAVYNLAYTGEFEKHAGCWMGWPDSGYLWRDGAAPAQEQYANIAKAISEFEPLTMFANAGPVRLLASERPALHEGRAQLLHGGRPWSRRSK